MLETALPIGFALVVWWIGTGVILYAIRLAPETYPRSLAAAALLLVLALATLAGSDGVEHAREAYIAFAAAVVVWGFVEVTFLTGWVTGSRTTDCPAGSRGWLRARYATEAIIYHELALVAAGAAIMAATWNGANRVAIATFAVLWIMRLSSKLNLFLGVRTLNDELLPPQLQHLRTYFLRRPMNLLYPFSVLVPGAATLLLGFSAFSPEATPFESTAFLLLASLLALAVAEHAFMMVPIPIAKLWRLDRGADAQPIDAELGHAEPGTAKPT